MKLKTILFISFLFSNYFSSAQCDSCLQEFDKVAVLPQTKLVILGKIISFQADTNFETYHYEDSNMIYTDSTVQIKDTLAKIWDTIISSYNYMDVEVLKIIKGIEQKRLVRVWFNHDNLYNPNRLSHYSFEKEGIYFLALSESGIYEDSVLMEYEPLGDYCVYSYGFRALRLAKDSVYYLSDENVLLNNRPVDSSSFEKHLKKYLLNTSYRKRHKITNEIHEDEIWLKLSRAFIHIDSVGININGQYYKYSENYRRIKIKKNKWNVVDGALVVLIPMKVYNTFCYAQEAGRTLILLDTNFKKGMGCYRFRFVNAPESVTVQLHVRFNLSSKDTDYVYTGGILNQYLGPKSILIKLHDSVFAEIKLHFYHDELYTITYDFLNKTYKVKFDGYLDEKKATEIKNKRNETNFRYTWPNGERNKVVYYRWSKLIEENF